MSNSLAIFYFLKSEYQRCPERWFTVREVASVIDLSINRTRRHLNILCLKNSVETKVDGWRNVYRFKR